MRGEETYPSYKDIHQIMGASKITRLMERVSRNETDEKVHKDIFAQIYRVSAKSQLYGCKSGGGFNQAIVSSQEEYEP